MTQQTEPQKKAVFSPKYLISILLMAGILVGTFYLLPRDHSLAEVKAVILSAKPGWILAGFGMMGIYQLSIAFSIRLLIRTFNRSRCPLELAHKTSYIGFFFNSITPSSSGGQPVQMYYLSRRGVDLSHSSLIFIVLAIFYNATIIIFSLIASLLKFKLVFSSLKFMTYFMVYGYLVNGAIVVSMILLIVKPRLITGFLKAISRLLFKINFIKKHRRTRFLRKISGFSAGYKQSSRIFLNRGSLLLRLAGLHMIQVLAYYFIPYFVSMSLGGRGAALDECLALQSVLYLSTSAVPTPGAVGVTESGFVTMFESILPSQQVVPAMFLTRLINFYAFVIIAGIVSAIAMITTKKKPLPQV